MTTELQNKAWSILPKEFKEEVKKQYQIAIDSKAYAVEYTLEYLFGHHNLTSDEEGEEMLICEKSKVQRAYNTSREIVKAENPDSLMYSMHTQIMCVLENIFGSKCLPDANEDNFVSIKPKPAEPKNEVEKMKPIKSYVKVYLATKEEDEEFRTLLYKNGFMWSSGTALISLSNWDSALEASHIHFVYHNKTVTYLGKRTKETLTFTEFKKRYFGEDVNLSQETVNCDKQFDNILKDGFHDHNRLHIASIIMSGLLASSKEKHPVRRAMDLADALIAECDKEGGEE